MTLTRLQTAFGADAMCIYNWYISGELTQFEYTRFITSLIADYESKFPGEGFYD